MIRLAVIGKDVSQSDSPRMHKFILGKFGETCVYDRISIAPSNFSTRIEGILQEYDAFNVTIPFKGDIIPFLEELRGDALSFGAVNTVVSHGRVGYNTDGYGFMLMLENAGVSVSGKRVLILGMGGAGRSCVKKLVEAGASVSVYEMSRERLMAAHRDVGGFEPLTEVPLEAFDIIVNCTGIGMHDTVGKTPTVLFADGTERAIGEEILSLCGTAVDLIYVPAESEFLRIAKKCGKPTVSGGAMLFYQAYYADCIFTGRTPSAQEAKSFWESYTEENV